VMNQTTGSVKFDEKTERLFQTALGRYPTREAALLPALWLARDQFGCLSNEVMEYVAERLDLAPVRVFSVVEFYTMFNREPLGRYHFQLCRNVSCTLRGSEQLLEVLREKLGIDPGEISGDGAFSLETVECLGSCGTAPVVRINETYYENLTIDRLEAIIEACRAGRDASTLEG
jgi:NADH-quinone oxidoreductase subunit E